MHIIIIFKISNCSTSINIEIIIAIIMGYIMYKRIKTFLSVAALIILYIFVWIGSTNPIKLETIGIAVKMYNIVGL